MTSCAAPLPASWTLRLHCSLTSGFGAAGSGRRSAGNRPFLLVTVGVCCSAQLRSIVAAALWRAGVHVMQAACALSAQEFWSATDVGGLLFQNPLHGLCRGRGFCSEFVSRSVCAERRRSKAEQEFCRWPGRL